MSEKLLLFAIVLSAGSGVAQLFPPRKSQGSERMFVALMTIAGSLAAVGAIGALAFGSSTDLSLSWSVPGGRLALRVDAISAMFVLPIAVLSVLGAWYGLEYWPEAEHPDNGRKLRAFFGAVTAGLFLLVVARNAVLFLIGWEIMALSAFFLVTTEDEKPTAREVGYIYLLSTRAGTLCLFAMFGLLFAASGTLDMEGWPVAMASPLSTAIFVLGVLGFGLKAGIVPLHVWLPGAHANAPSHVSALMSGVLIKSGIYGLVRMTAACGSPPLAFGYALVAIGAVSGILGVAFAIGQHDLKRLLAYHSVENIGIICLGLGVAVLGRTLGRPELVVLGVSGALLHVWNHGLFKGLLFLSAGAVVHSTNTRSIDRLGGLFRRMPRTGLAFLVGSVAICGLPPLNGLVSELLVYLGLFRTASEGGSVWIAGALAAPALAVIGALAVGCFVKVFGAVFLGVPRTEVVERAHEVGLVMMGPMIALGGGCLFIGLAAPVIAPVLDAAAAVWVGATSSIASAPGIALASGVTSAGTTAGITSLGTAAGFPSVAPSAAAVLDLPSLGDMAPLAQVSALSGALLGTILLIAAILVRRARKSPSSLTWDCGYAAPTARMQYTSSSFAALIVHFLGWALRPTAHLPRIVGPFPRQASFSSHVPDTVLDRGLLPVVSGVGVLLARLRPIQRGSIHLYLLYVLGALVALLLWR